jgi:hypothetical protein
MASWKLSNVRVKEKTVYKPEAYLAYGEPDTMMKAKGCLFKPEGMELFCNAEKKAGSAYCPTHHACCYQRAK